MRLAWYTPFSTRSAIGKFSGEVITALAELGHETTLVRSERTEDSASALDAAQRVVSARDIDDKVESFLKDFDCVLYNIGNHFSNHSYAIDHQRRVPGISLLHDFCLHHLLCEWVVATEKSTYVDVLEREAGPTAVSTYEATADSRLHSDWFMSQAVQFPVLRFAMPHTLGIVTHSEFYRDICVQRCDCLTRTIPLAYPCETEKRLPPPTIDAHPLRLITIGDVNLNKRFESIIRAIGSSQELSQRWQYRIIGSAATDYERQLKRINQLNEFPVDIAFLGKVDDAELVRELEQCHAIACLRYPIIEGASASVIVSLASGRPTLVSEGGCYSEIPAEFVLRVRHADEIGDLQAHLRGIADDFSGAVRRSMAAKQWAVARHSGRNYASQLVPFIEEVIEQQPLIELADRVASHLSCWECTADSAIVNRVESAALGLFAPTSFGSLS